MESKQNLPEPETIWNKSYICIIIANFMLSLGHGAVNPLVATYTKYLNTSAQMTGFLTGMFFAVSFAGKPFTGPAMTKLDKRKLLIWVFMLGSIANVGYALFHSVHVFVVFRFLSGVQYSLVGPLLMTLSGDHLPMSRLTYGLGIYGIGGAIGSAVAPSIGVAILDFGTNLRGESFGFTLMFLSGALIFFLAIIPSYIISPDRKTKDDIAGTGAWYTNIFTIHAMPTALVMLLLMTSYSTINTYIIEFAGEQGITGISVFFVVLALMLAISRPLSGYFTHKLGMTRIVFPALAIFSCSMLIIGSTNTLRVALIGAALAAIGFGSSQPSIQAITLQSETAMRRGVATNTLYMGIDMGLFLGPFLGGLVYARSDYAFMYKTGAMPVLIAIICFAFAIPIHKRRQKELETLDKSS